MMSEYTSLIHSRSVTVACDAWLAPQTRFGEMPKPPGRGSAGGSVANECQSDSPIAVPLRSHEHSVRRDWRTLIGTGQPHFENCSGTTFVATAAGWNQFRI